MTATALQARSAAPRIIGRTARSSRAEHRVRLQGVSWASYLSLREDDGLRRARMTYDGEVLEIMTVGFEHENLAYFLGRLVDELTMAADTDVRGLRTPTLRHDDARKGLEPDNCYYLRSAALIKGRTELRFPGDPPPDLAIEVDISRSSLDREPIYASLGVPEIWRCAGRKLTFRVLQKDGTYAASRKSLAFPAVSSSMLQQYIDRLRDEGETSVIRSFRDSLRPAGGASRRTKK